MLSNSSPENIVDVIRDLGCFNLKWQYFWQKIGLGRPRLSVLPAINSLKVTKAKRLMDGKKTKGCAAVSMRKSGTLLNDLGEQQGRGGKGRKVEKSRNRDLYSELRLT